jgi:hypothetical protein
MIRGRFLKKATQKLSNISRFAGQSQKLKF